MFFLVCLLNNFQKKYGQELEEIYLKMEKGEFNLKVSK